MGSTCSSSPSSRWNRSISALRDRREEAISSLGAVLLGKSVEEAIQLVEDLFEPKNQAQKCLCELIWDHRLLSHGPRPGMFLTEACSQELNGWLAAAYLHL